MASLRRKPEPEVPDAAPAEAPAAPLQPEPQPPDESLALKRQVEQLTQSEALASQQAQIEAETNARRLQWFHSTPLAQKYHQALDGLHGHAMDAGYVDTSPEYFKFLGDQLAYIEAAQPTTAATNLAHEMQRTAQEHTPPQPKEPAAMVSAPVSRAAPGMSGRESGKITLNAADQEAAKISGVTLEEYARQKLKLQRMRESGEYSDQRG